MSSDLLSWKIWLVFLLAFGFSPRLVLRIVIRLWPKEDARRQETIAALDHIPYSKRLLFVVEQLEAALVDGLGERWRRRQTTARPRAVHTASRLWVPLLFIALMVGLLVTRNWWVAIGGGAGMMATVGLLQVSFYMLRRRVRALDREIRELLLRAENLPGLDIDSLTEDWERAFATATTPLHRLFVSKL